MGAHFTQKSPVPPPGAGASDVFTTNTVQIIHIWHGKTWPGERSAMRSDEIIDISDKENGGLPEVAEPDG